MTHQTDPQALAPTPENDEAPRWTGRKMVEFLRMLAATHSVSAAARAVGMSRQSAYRLRTRQMGKPFDRAWDAAFDDSYRNLPYAALERALNGIEVPHFYKGELIGTSRRYDERLTVALLRLIGRESLMDAGDGRTGAEMQGRRFQSLLARIETEGDGVEERPGGALPRPNPAKLSPA